MYTISDLIIELIQVQSNHGDVPLTAYALYGADGVWNYWNIEADYVG